MAEITARSVATMRKDDKVSQEIRPSQLVFSFPIGIPGYPEVRGFQLVPLGVEFGPYLALKAVGDDYPVFVVVQPSAVLDNYVVDIDDLHEGLLGLEGGSANLLVLLIVTLSQSDPCPRANLAAPLVINLDKMTGFQVPQGNPEFAMDHQLSVAFRDQARSEILPNNN